MRKATCFVKCEGLWQLGEWLRSGQVAAIKRCQGHRMMIPQRPMILRLICNCSSESGYSGHHLPINVIDALCISFTVYAEKTLFFTSC